MMDDFGKILDQWEANSSRAEKKTASDFGQILDKYPVVDKDATGQDDARQTLRIAPEKLPVDDSIDLHGMTLAEALAATDAFLTASIQKGHRKVLIIHGKGRDGEGVLRREIRPHLERDDRTGAMGYPGAELGGRGALWVVLRYRSR
jgi:DNA-nicking Smr family endonuclease